MKRCPSCKFFYLDTDEVCDFDGAKLVLVDENEVESVVADGTVASLAQLPAPGKTGKRVALAAFVGLGLGVVMFLVYFAAVRRAQSVAQSVQPPVQVTTPSQPAPVPTLTPSPSPTVEPSPLTPERHNDSPASTATRANVSKNPVSTSTRSETQTGVLIRLTNGARIEADEVWRTKEGVWYRRNGLVTLLKASQVKAIEKSARSQ
ncbi:MAG TPA: hypothetical protein VF074_02810 [Pyrinomonadaceae bacterium]